MPNIITRAIFGLIYITAIIFASLYSPLSLVILLGVFMALCVWELTQILQFDNKLYLAGTILVSAYVFYLYANKFWISGGMYDTRWVNFLPALLFVLSLIIIFRNPTELYFDSSKLIFTVVYAVLPFALIFATVKEYHINNFESINPIIALFVLLWCSDTFAYLTGKYFGKRKFSYISPNKTVEGLIGGAFFTIIAGIIINYNFPRLNGNWIIISIIIALVAPIGDLAESKLKRVFGVKDSGKLIPGHGGFLDRLDSFLPAAVALYIYFLFIQS